MSPLHTYHVTVPGKGACEVQAYTPKWAAVQGLNVLRLETYTCWVRQLDVPHRVKAERIRPFDGFGR